MYKFSENGDDFSFKRLYDSFSKWKNKIKNDYENSTENNLDNVFSYWDTAK